MLFLNQPCPNLSNSWQIYLTANAIRQVNTPETSSNDVEIQDWAFSPTGQAVLYATQTKDIKMFGADGQPIDFHLKYYPAFNGETRDNLQWSKDGTRLLIYSNSWYVLDAATGRPVWENLAPDTQAVIKYRLSDGNDAALSPDGRWITTSYYDTNEAMRRMVIVSLETGQTTQIGDWIASFLR